MDHHQGQLRPSRQGQAQASPQAQDPPSSQGRVQPTPRAQALSSRQGQPPLSKTQPLSQPRALQTMQQQSIPRPHHVQPQTVQMQDRELPEGDLTGSILWPKAPDNMFDKTDVALAQNKVIMQKLHANEKLMEEHQKVINRQFGQLFGMMRAVGEKVGIDPLVLLNSKPSSKSTMTAKKEAAKTIATDIDPGLKVSITEASRKYLHDFPGLMLKTLTQKAKNEDYVTKWAAFVEKRLEPDAQHVSAFSSFEQAEKEMLYKEMANLIRPSTKKINKAVQSDHSDEEGPDDTTIRQRTMRNTRKRPRVEQEQEVDDYDGSTLFVSDEEDRDYAEEG